MIAERLKPKSEVGLDTFFLFEPEGIFKFHIYNCVLFIAKKW